MRSTAICLKLTTALAASLLLCIATINPVASSKPEDLKIQVSNFGDRALQAAPKNGTISNVEKEATSGRSMESSPASTKQSSRGGRMLDLDLMAGDIGKDEKMARERSLSGQRQSRILNEDISLDSTKDSKVDGRSKKSSKGKKKMAISGFIPIMSLEGAKDGKHFEAIESSANSSDDNEEDEEDSSQQYQQPDAASSTKNQLISSFGGQTSIGHASFGVQPMQNEQQLQQVIQQQQQQQQQWQQVAPNQYEQQDAARANRKLLGTGGILGSLGSSKRFVSSLVQQPHLSLQSLQSQTHPQVQAPMNIPPLSMLGSVQSVTETSECICVPFFQCTNGYLSESQLSKSQLQQLVGFSASPPFGGNQHQIPRSLNLNSGSTSDLYYSNNNNNNNNNQPQISSLMSQIDSQRQLMANQAQPNQEQQQLVNDIYDQLRKRIESENLEQQLQQQQQMAQQPAYLSLDERSKSALQQKQQQQQNRTADGDVLERSLVNALGRRSGGHQQKCGIMRTCCKIPQSLVSQQSQQMGFNRGQQHSPRLGSLYQGPQSSALSLRPMMQSVPQMNQQPQYQMIQAASTNPNQQLMTNHQPFLHQQQPQQQQQQHLNHFQQPPPQSHHHQIDYQPSTSALVPTQLALGSVQQQQQRPVGSFMAGRCGTKQTIGISGRVQNTQPAPGSETNAEFGEFPSHVAILKRLSPGDSLFVCSAVLISNQWVATAAHCVRKHRPEDLKLRLGEWDVNRDDEFYPFVESNVREIIIHPDFQPTSLINDVALLRLDNTIDPQQMPHITPACLATPDEVFNQQRCWVTGWGKDAFGQGGAFQSVLKKVDLPVVGRQECEMALRYQTKLGKFFRLHQSAMCAGGERGKDACEGDGGAGLYCTDPDSGLTKVAGLVSWGVGCGQKGVPGVYTNLATFYNWIETVVAASGEESLYLDRNGVPDNTFKNLISERSNAGGTAINSTIIDDQKQSNSTTSLPEQPPTTVKPSSVGGLGESEEAAFAGESDKDLESHAQTN